MDFPQLTFKEKPTLNSGHQSDDEWGVHRDAASPARNDSDEFEKVLGEIDRDFSNNLPPLQELEQIVDASRKQLFQQGRG
mmetsp:Transcript_12403/g.19383  ORF Transcript_12403/g.19383 Transcript_12403/m.19383 type:complete len:80 (+) Transcript_12403:3-242(+)